VIDANGLCSQCPCGLRGLTWLKVTLADGRQVDGKRCRGGSVTDLGACVRISRSQRVAAPLPSVIRSAGGGGLGDLPLGSPYGLSARSPSASSAACHRKHQQAWAWADKRPRPASRPMAAISIPAISAPATESILPGRGDRYQHTSHLCAPWTAGSRSADCRFPDQSSPGCGRQLRNGGR